MPANYENIEKETRNDRRVVDEYINDMENEGTKVRKSLSDIMSKTDKNLEDKRIEAYKSKNEISNDHELSSDELKEAKKFEISELEMTNACKDAAREMYNLYFERNRKLNSLLGNKSEQQKAIEDGKEPKLGKIDKNIESLDNELKTREDDMKKYNEEIESINSEIESLSADIEEGQENPNQPRIDELNAQLAQLNEKVSTTNEEINKINAIKAKTEDLRQSCIHAMGLQKDVRSNIDSKLKDSYGEKIASQVIAEQGSKQREQEYNDIEDKREQEENNKDVNEKDQVGQTVDDKDGQEQAQNTVSGPAQQVAGAAAAQKVAGAAQQAVSQGARADGTQQNPGAVTVDDVKKGNIPKEYLSAMFGIENLSSLDGNYEKSWEVLQMFSSSAIPDSTRLELLNDNKSRLIIMKAFEEVDSFHPRKGAQYIDTRMKLLNLRTPMMETALKSMGIEITDTKNIASDFAKMSKELDKMEKTIKEDKSMDPEMKEAKLEELNKYRDSYKNVNKFIAATNKVKSPRTYLRQAKQWLSQNIRIFEKDNLQKLAAADEEVKPKDNRADEPTVDNTDVREQEVKTTDRAEFVKNYGTNTEMTELKAKQILDEDKTQETKNINSQEIDESQIGK